MTDEYDLGYFEGLREAALMYNRNLIPQKYKNAVMLELQSENFVSELAIALKEAKELRDRKPTSRSERRDKK